MKKALYRLEIYYNESASSTEREVLKYFLYHTREVVEMDIHTLAKQCFCSAATIIRICKKNEFTGFKELKMALMNDINFSSQLQQVSLHAMTEHSLSTTVARVLNDSIQSIENVYNLLDFDELNQIIQQISKCQYIYLFGIGASFLVVKDLQQKFERINKKTFLYEDLHMQMVSSTNIEDRDVAIIASYSGLTKEIVDIAKNIKQRNGIIIAITKYGSSKLISLSDYTLFVPNLETPLRTGASSSRVSQLSIVDILYNSYLTLEKDKAMDKIMYTNKLLEKKEN